MKKIFTLLLAFLSISTFAQQTGSITVGGDFDKFYPVTFTDGGWGQNVATELEIGRSNTHLNSLWRGSLIAKLHFHVSNWGNGANFISAYIFQSKNVQSAITTEFIAGWADASSNNNNSLAIIWLRGGGTTYLFKSNYNTNPVV